MANHEKGPGMRSDRPGITTNVLDLDVSPTCLREKEGELLEVWCGLVGERKGALLYKSILADPTALRRSGLSTTLGADRPPMKILI